MTEQETDLMPENDTQDTPKTGRGAGTAKLAEVTKQRDAAREVIARVAEALSVDPASSDDEVVEAARSRFNNLYLLGEAAGAGPEEPWQTVAHRIRSAGQYVRVLRGGS